MDRQIPNITVVKGYYRMGAVERDADGNDKVVSEGGFVPHWERGHLYAIGLEGYPDSWEAVIEGHGEGFIQALELVENYRRKLMDKKEAKTNA